MDFPKLVLLDGTEPDYEEEEECEPLEEVEDWKS